MDRDLMIRAGKGLTLSRLERSDAAELFAVIDRNRAYLRDWMPWLDRTRSVDDLMGFIEGTMRQFEDGLGPQFKIVEGGAVVGAMGFHPIDAGNRVGEIGYWLSEDAQGRGVVTRCVAALVRHGFDEMGLNRIEIPAAVGNVKSRAVAERLGFALEGVLRQRGNLYGRFVDHAMYGLLREDDEAGFMGQKR